MWLSRIPMQAPGVNMSSRLLERPIRYPLKCWITVDDMVLSIRSIAMVTHLLYLRETSKSGHHPLIQP